MLLRSRPDRPSRDHASPHWRDTREATSPTEIDAHDDLDGSATTAAAGAAGSTAGEGHAAGALTRRTAWLTLLGFVLVLVAASGLFRTAQIPARGEATPATAESARVAAELKARPGADVSPVMLVATRADGGALTQADKEALTRLTSQVTQQGLPPVGPPRATLSEDGRAATTLVPVKTGESSSDAVAPVTAIRDAVGAHKPADLTVEVTGGPAFGADIAGAFSGADVRLLFVTIAIVAVLLLLTYRSPTLWLIPLIVVALADQLAAVVTKAAGQASGLTYDSGIVSVLVFGAGTNYALLLISRYREELRRESDHRVALATARRAVLSAILASNLTVVFALLTLLLAVVPGTRGLGLAGALGLLIAAGAALLPLPAALSLVGRKAFWPFVPRPGDDVKAAADAPDTSDAADTANATDATDAPEKGRWLRLGEAVTARPLTFAAGSLVLLGVLATSLVGTRIGLTQAEQFRVASDSQRGLSVVAAHFPAGSVAPLTVLADQSYAETLTRELAAVPHVSSVRPGAVVDGRAALTVTGDAVPGSEEAQQLVAAVRDRAAATPDAHALVGGSPAVQLDAREAADRDLRVIAPIILGLTAVVLMLLLKAIRVPLALLAINALSALATIGAGAWVGRTFFGFPALDVQVPLIAFLFLVALGVDYTIFLVHRADQEARAHGVRAGMARAVGATGAVITSAGVVLAGVFAALGVLPLVVLGQLGLIVGLGVLVDTFVVRALLVPAAVTLLGRRAERTAAAA